VSGHWHDRRASFQYKPKARYWTVRRFGPGVKLSSKTQSWTRASSAAVTELVAVIPVQAEGVILDLMITLLLNLSYIVSSAQE
jgi:hypothetical protein